MWISGKKSGHIFYLLKIPIYHFSSQSEWSKFLRYVLYLEVILEFHALALGMLHEKGNRKNLSSLLVAEK